MFGLLLWPTVQVMVEVDGSVGAATTSDADHLEEGVIFQGSRFLRERGILDEPADRLSDEFRGARGALDGEMLEGAMKVLFQPDVGRYVTYAAIIQ